MIRGTKWIIVGDLSQLVILSHYNQTSIINGGDEIRNISR